MWKLQVWWEEFLSLLIFAIIKRMIDTSSFGYMFCRNLSPLIGEYDTFLIDVYGVLYNGSDFYDGVLDLLVDMRTAGKRVIILSNTTMVASACLEKYTPKGLTERHYDVFISSGEAFKNTISDHVGGAKTYFSAFAKNADIFRGSSLVEVNSIDQADFVYIGYLNSRRFYVANALRDKTGRSIPMEDLTSMDCHDISDFDEITEVIDQCLKYDKPIVIANPDIFALEYVSTSEFHGRLPVLCQGSVGEFYEYLGGEVIYFGKPYQAIYDYAKKFVSSGDRVAMVGDTLWTDILGGNIAGVDTILTLTGVSGEFLRGISKTDIEGQLNVLLSDISSKMTHKSLAGYSQIPTHIVESFA